MKFPYGFEIQDNCRTCTWRASRFFCGVSGIALRHLQRIATIEVHAAGTVLYAEGQAAKGVYVLCNGHAKISTSSPRGSILILKIAQPGEVLGLGAVLANRFHEETAKLLDSCQVKFIAKHELARYLSGNTEATLKTALQMQNDCDSAREQVRRLGSSISGTQKLAQILTLWANESKCGPGRAFMVPFTHGEIAQMIGSTRETVTRALKKFRQEKVVEIQHGTFLVKDMKRLAQFACD